MADKKISQLTSGTPASQSVLLEYEFPVQRGGANFKLNLQDVMNLIGPAATTSPYSAYTFPNLSAIAASLTSASVSGNISLTGTLSVNTGVGTSGQALVSRGIGLSPTWGNVIPPGAIILWSGLVANIPDGWTLCNGVAVTRNGITVTPPDLRNTFVIGANADAVVSGQTQAATTVTGVTTKTGGNKDSVTVSHTHDYVEPNAGQGHQHYSMGEAYGAWPFGTSPDAGHVGTHGGVDSDNYYWNTSLAKTGITIMSTGISGTNLNLPPYYALAYIMRLSYP